MSDTQRHRDTGSDDQWHLNNWENPCITDGVLLTLNDIRMPTSFSSSGKGRTLLSVIFHILFVTFVNILLLVS